MKLLDAMLSLLFPDHCMVCGEDDTSLCLRCLANFPPPERDSASWIFPLFDYRYEPLRKAIWLLKYKNKKNIARTFGELMHERMVEEMADLSMLENFRNPLLIPIPLSRKRYRERGFNQSELLCKEIIACDTENYFELETKSLIRKKDGEHQARIENRNERLKNIIGSFGVVNGEKIKNRNIILIDDVTTTGATLAEAKKVLKENGVKKVVAFTIAH